MKSYPLLTAKIAVLALSAFALSNVSGSAQSTIYWNTSDAPSPGTAHFTDPVWTTYSVGPGYSTPPAALFSSGSGQTLVFSDPSNPSGAQTAQTLGGDNIGAFDFESSDPVTIEADPGVTNPGLTVDNGILMGSGAGTVTFDTSLGAYNSGTGLSSTGSGSFHTTNNSSSNLNINTDIIGGSGQTLLNNGTGTGSVVINGNYENGNIDQESATSTLYYNGNDGAPKYSGLTTINYGTIVANSPGSVQNSSAVDLKHGGTLTFQNSGSFTNNLVVTNGGTLNFSGDSLLAQGNGNSNTITADSLTIGSGDALDVTNGQSHIGTLNLNNGGAFGRLIVGIAGQGYGLIANTTHINVANNYILDFGGTGTQTVSSQVTVASGGAIEARTNGTTTLTNVSFPTSGTFITGADDDGQGGVLNFSQNISLPGTWNVAINGYNELAEFSGNISGNGGFNFSGNMPNSNAWYQSSTVALSGTNSYKGPTILTLPTQATSTNGNYASNQVALVINGDSSHIGSDIEVQGNQLYVDPSGKLPTNAVVALNGVVYSPQNNWVGAFGSFLVGDGAGATNSTIGGLSSGGTYIGGNAANSYYWGNVGNGNSSGAISTLTLAPGAGQLNEFQGQVGTGVTNGINTGFSNNFANYGSWYNNLKIVKSGAGTQWFTTSFNNTYSGGTEIDGGVMAINGGDQVYNVSGNYTQVNVVPDANNVLIGSALGTGPVTINNGATLDIANGSLYTSVNLGTTGSVTYSGDTWQAAGTIAGYNPTNNNGIDYFVYAPFTGGGGLVVGPGDLLAATSVAGTPGNIYVLGGRLLMFNNTTFIDGATSVTAADGGNLDFGTGGSASASMPVYVGPNGTITERGTNVTINNLVPEVGTSGHTPSLNIGTDDASGSSGSIHVTNQVNLTSNFQVNGWEDDNNYTDVVFSGGFKGNGNLTIGSVYQTTYPSTTLNRGIIKVTGTNIYKGDTKVVGGILDLQGDSTGVTSATGGAPNYIASGTQADVGVYNPGILQVGQGGSIASNASVTVGGSSAGQYGYFAMGDYNGAANVEVGSIHAGAGGGAIFNGDYANRTMETLNVNVAANTTDVYTGAIGSDPYSYDFNRTAEGQQILNNANQIALVKNGAGTLALNGTNSYVGGTTVNGGRLAVNSSIIGGVQVNAGAEVGGSGVINGGITGAGAVGPGNSPGILTASSVDPSSNMSFNFELTLNGPAVWSAASASGNDVLHLDSGSPFTTRLARSNVINVYLGGFGKTYVGGFFVDGDTNNLNFNIANATYNYYIAWNTGDVSYNGNNYLALDPSFVTAGIVGINGANFATGTTDGFTEEFVVAVPEPSTWAMMIGGLLLLVYRCHNRRKNI